MYAWRVNLDAVNNHSVKIDPGISQQLTFKKPTLFIRGEKSDYILPEDESWILKTFPDATFIEIIGASHWLHAEKPDEVIDALIKFL